MTDDKPYPYSKWLIWFPPYRWFKRWECYAQGLDPDEGGIRDDLVKQEDRYRSSSVEHRRHNRGDDKMTDTIEKAIETFLVLEEENREKVNRGDFEDEEERAALQGAAGAYHDAAQYLEQQLEEDE